MGKRLPFIILFTLSCIISPLIIFGQGQKEEANNRMIEISFKVYDKLTKRRITWCRSTIKELNDSVSKPINLYGADQFFRIPIDSKYLISVYAEVDSPVNTPGKFDCEPHTFVLDLTDVKPDEFERQLPNIYLSRYVEHKLDEVTVTPSKVKFYYKGDTLVYNANAFITQDGSMLDGLLRQIPDIELRRGGEIFHRGKRVENLLLNGKDLFNGDRQLMLENIGAYTVRDINLYNETGRDSKLLGYDVGDTKYTMNVRLKRQYSQGFILNANLGYGTRDRYTGNLFGMWFSENVSLSLSGSSTNNTNVYDPAYIDGQFYTPTASETGGVQTTNTGALNYTAEGYASKWKVTGNAKYVEKRPTTIQSRYMRNYLTTGDTYSYSWTESRNRNRSFSSEHKAEFSIREKINMTVEPKFFYTTNFNRYSSLSATLNKELGDNALSVVEGIYNGGNEAVAALLNRTRLIWRADGENITGSLNARGIMPTGKRSHLTLTAYGRIYNRSLDEWQAYNLGYGGENGDNTTRLQHFRYDPHRDTQIRLQAHWRHRIWKYNSLIGLRYTFTRFKERHGKSTFSNMYDGNMMADTTNWNILPSMTHNLPEIASQSYLSDYDEHRNLISLETILRKRTAAADLMLNVEMLFRFAKRDFIYERGGHTQYIDRRELLPGLNVKATFSSRKYINRYMELTFNSTPYFCSLFNVVDIIDDTNPLYVYLGNPDLKNYRTNNLRLYINFAYTNLWNHRLTLNYNSTHNANARGYYYNTITGVKTFKTYNIDGNFTTRADYDLTRYFNHPDWNFAKSITATSSTGISYSRNVDLVGSTTEESPDFSTPPPVRKVGSLSVSENAGIKADLSSCATIGANARLSYNRFSSPEPGFTDFSSWVNKYSVNAFVKLPYNWGISSDFGLFTRSGFNDRSLNTTDILWNAKATKSVWKGRIVFSLTAYDILQRLSNVAYTVNAQARTETVSNVVPSYLMLSVQYRWNKNPSKKKKFKS